jgi:YfiH family protein
MAEVPEIEVIQADWPAPPNVRAFTTTRNGGFSLGPWSSLNLGANCGDDPQHVEKNRQSLLRLLPSEPPWLDQVHGTEVIGWDKAKGAGIEADAIVSSEAGQVCAVLTADCLPVIFCDKKGTRIAAAHAGWRGLAAGVLEATVLAMDCKPSDLMVWLGPAIGPQAFEVGRDVFDAFANSNIENANAFKPHRDRWLADLYQLARLTLARAGITQISGGQYCTYAEEYCFYSYRRDGETGRLATVIWML